MHKQKYFSLLMKNICFVWPKYLLSIFLFCILCEQHITHFFYNKKFLVFTYNIPLLPQKMQMQI